MKESLHERIRKYIDTLTIEISNCKQMIDVYKNSNSFALALQEQTRMNEKILNKETLIDTLK